MGEQTKIENAERPLDNNAYHVLAMLLAPMITKAYQDTTKRSEAKLDKYCDCLRVKINGRWIRLSPIEVSKTTQ